MDFPGELVVNNYEDMWGRALYIFFEVIVKVVIPQIGVGLLKAVQMLVDVFTVILVGTDLC